MNPSRSKASKTISTTAMQQQMYQQLRAQNHQLQLELNSSTNAQGNNNLNVLKLRDHLARMSSNNQRLKAYKSRNTRSKKGKIKNQELNLTGSKLDKDFTKQHYDHLKNKMDLR